MKTIKATLSLVALATAIGAATADNNGQVYIETNSAGGNQVLVYTHGNDGVLTARGSYSTGGLGTGSGLGSQGAITLSPTGNRLYAVDAGTNDIAEFAVEGAKLRKIANYPTGGSTPISVTAAPGLVYVLNAGGAANIAGYRATGAGLNPITTSVRSLSGDNVGPAQIQFSPDASVLVVTEKNTALIDSWSVTNGVPGSLSTTPSSGPTPFGFDFDRAGRLFVSEAPISSASSYELGSTGWNLLSASVPNHQVAACWLKVSPDGRFAYTANAGNGTISGYSVSDVGLLSLLTPSGLNGSTGADSHPVDLGFSKGGQFLYALANGNGTIAEFKVNEDGSLVGIGTVTGIPTSAQGLASR